MQGFRRLTGAVCRCRGLPGAAAFLGTYLHGRLLHPCVLILEGSELHYCGGCRWLHSPVSHAAQRAFIFFFFFSRTSGAFQMV